MEVEKPLNLEVPIMVNRQKYIDDIAKLKSEDNYRFLQTQKSDTLIDLSSNDYLALLKDDDFINNFYYDFEGLTYKPGSGSSRLLSGNSEIYKELEELLCSYYERESALIFNSGYHANMGILSALAGKKDLIIADKFVHASIIDGMQLSKATTTRFKHQDYSHLERLLSKSRSAYRNIFIVTESIFSMDGDVADLKRLVEIKKKYECFLYVDEAHAVGVRGGNGLGCSEEEQVIKDIDFIVGTFGKALASVGAFIICDNIFKEFLVNHSRTLIYTTALPQVNLAWTKYVMENIPNLIDKRNKLQKLSKQFAELIEVIPQSHIVPFVIGDNRDTITISNILKQKGFNVMPVRYPTVPKGSARIRFSLNSELDFSHLSEIKKIIEVHG